MEDQALVPEAGRRVEGGCFLARALDVDDVFTPEEFTPEQRQYAKTARDFVENEVCPASERIEGQDHAFTRQLTLRAGELGLLMTDVPEEYGGLALDKVAAALIYENLAGQTSFQTQCGVHASIGSLPLVYYGTPEQKSRYLPLLATGEWIGCYCLTEPAVGSDALACRTRAVLSDDGTHYVLNGTKQFITNGGIADVFTVFAKVDGKQFTAFVLERATPGLSTGPEEHKLGLKGSSTTTVVLQDARVPVANVLGTVGEGHKIAFNILNFGRLKLAVQATGYCKRALDHALAYTLERKQFGRRIAEFGAIREKLAELYVQTYALEAAAYRTLGHIEHELARGDRRDGGAVLAAGEEFRVECALVKALGTEILDFVVDEALQCFGGYGYCSEYPLERMYRDARINRIYEGTNEINRIFAASALFRLAAEGRLPLGGAEGAPPAGGEGAPAGLLKRVCLLVLEAAAAVHGKGVAQHQAVLTRVADLAMLAYFAESAALRAAKDARTRGEEGAGLALASARIFCEGALNRAEVVAREVLVSLGEAGEGVRESLTRLLRRKPADLLALRERLASELVERERTGF